MPAYDDGDLSYGLDENHDTPVACYWCGSGVLATDTGSTGRDVCNRCWYLDDDRYQDRRADCEDE